MQEQGNIIVGLDIGPTKICAIVGEAVAGKLNIIGIGTHPSIGLRKGVVVNIESTVESIKKAVEEAELMAGCEINSVYTGIADRARDVALDSLSRGRGARLDPVLVYVRQGGGDDALTGQRGSRGGGHTL